MFRSAEENERINTQDAPVSDPQSSSAVSQALAQADASYRESYDLIYALYQTGDLSQMDRLREIFWPANDENFVANSLGVHDRGFEVTDASRARVTTRLLPNSLVQNGVLLLEGCRDLQGLTVVVDGKPQPMAWGYEHEVATVERTAAGVWQIRSLVRLTSNDCPFS